MIFVDASAVVAIVAFEPEKDRFSERLQSARSTIVSPIVIYEATLALRRIGGCSVTEARSLVDRFASAIGAENMHITAGIGDLALDAFARYGKGHHRAALNMGDCFSYACAKARDVPLLFKGDDFGNTDIGVA